MTLHDRIISEAPEGFSIRACPGAFDAYIAKHGDEHACRYVGTNDDERHKQSVREQLQRWIASR